MATADDYWQSLCTELLALPQETGWVEFKHNNESPQEIGEYVSALANTAALQGKAKGYLVWGVQDGTQTLVGTSFDPQRSRVGAQELESWLLQLLSPKLNFSFRVLSVQGLRVVVMEVDAAFRHPVQFRGDEWIRVGSYKKRLREFAEMERELWRTLDRTPFEWLEAADRLSAPEVLALLDYPAYFERLKLPLPDGHEALLKALAADRLVEQMDSGHWRIFNLGALLFARRMADFGPLGRKALRVVRYHGTDRLNAWPEPLFPQGYAMAFEQAVGVLLGWLPGNEVVGKALRQDVRMYPAVAIRELVANALIHQDLTVPGSSPLVELFDDRLEICNPGVPLVATERLLDTPPRSRNEAVASLMRRMNFCEERGTGVDKVVASCEFHQLPAPQFESVEGSLRATLFAMRPLTRMTPQERIRALYWHACLRHVNGQHVNNASVRVRFGIGEGNSAVASRLLKEAETAKSIRQFDPGAAPKLRRYVPWWV